MVVFYTRTGYLCINIIEKYLINITGVYEIWVTFNYDKVVVENRSAAGATKYVLIPRGVYNYNDAWRGSGLGARLVIKLSCTSQVFTVPRRVARQVTEACHTCPIQGNLFSMFVAIPCTHYALFVIWFHVHGSSSYS